MRDTKGRYTWNGQKEVIWNGYVWVWQPEHPRAKHGRVKRAILVLEEELGRPLMDNCLAHHIDNNHLNDVPWNLEEVEINKHRAQHASKGGIYITDPTKYHREYMRRRSKVVTTT